MDDFEGSKGDPLSLHKYFYVGNDPVNQWDPSGRFGFATETTYAARESARIRTENTRTTASIAKQVPKQIIKSGGDRSVALAVQVALKTTARIGIEILIETLLEEEGWNLTILYRGVDKKNTSPKAFRIDRGKEDPFKNGLSASESCLPAGKDFYVPFLVVYKGDKVERQTIGIVVLPRTLFAREVVFTPTLNDPTHWSMFAFDDPSTDEQTQKDISDWAKSLAKKEKGFDRLIPTSCD